MSELQLPPHVLFYDGVCAMCNGLVRWMLRVDRNGVFHFAPLQGQTAERVRQLHPEFPKQIETVVYLREGRVLLRSRAATQAMRELPYPAKALSWLRFLPTWLGDFFYGIIARWRYRVFGRYGHCPLPPAEARDRFLP
ncbi:MAG: DCC1-like thiol-disulfide oxidoreductase family protein [Myxococcales bacterium]|jgi:predicted DCC family thiol-disulfide oxidoreductase YuxK